MQEAAVLVRVGEEDRRRVRKLEKLVADARRHAQLQVALANLLDALDGLLHGLLCGDAAADDGNVARERLAAILIVGEQQRRGRGLGVYGARLLLAGLHFMRAPPSFLLASFLRVRTRPRGGVGYGARNNASKHAPESAPRAQALKWSSRGLLSRKVRNEHTHSKSSMFMVFNDS